MKPTGRLPLAVVIAALALALTSAWDGGQARAAAPPTLDHTVTLTAEGGATVRTPDWTSVRQDEALAILEQLPDPAQKRPFYVLVVTIEALATPEGRPVPWEKIRDNIVAAAVKKGRTMTLEVGEAFGAADGFEGRAMSGRAKTGEDGEVRIDVVALAGGGRLVTVSVVTDAAYDGGAAMASAIAGTTTAGAP
ncbi:MAG: hypothetical protein KC635_16405 [Myxococcales bacterium]|nr:hypothetical protein [Myxococcales bacterium]MCB9735672.1 hypothetical protein [Deltaproteobacteria bacterium]